MNFSWVRTTAAHRSSPGDPQLDAIGHRQVTITASLLDHAHEVAGLALDLQLRREVDVEHDDPDAAAERGARRVLVGLQGQHELAWIEAVPSGDDAVVLR